MDIKAAGVALEVVDLDPELRSLFGGGLYRELCHWGVFHHWSRRWPGAMDLHKFTRPIARAALTVTMQDILEAATATPNKPPRGVHPVGEDLVIIVGKSGHVIRGTVQDFFEVECQPHLPITSQDHNDGRVVVRSQDLIRWVRAHQEARQAMAQMTTKRRLKESMDPPKTK